MSTPFFSVIVPAHNSEGYIRMLLHSVRAQTYTDYELIVVCDRCTDRTAEIAASYGARVEQVDYGRDGLSRDRGLELAKGDWILFADDDDWFIGADAFRKIADVAGSHGEDVLMFGYEWKWHGYTPPVLREAFLPRVTRVWNKCWRASAIDGARFGDAVFCSDTYFLRAMRHRVPLSRVALLDEPLYYYNFMRAGSQTDLFCKGIIKQSHVAR